MFDNYYLHDTDDAGIVKYYGYTDDIGNWIIVKTDTATTPKTNRFAYGRSNYTANFTGRVLLSYGLLADIIKNIQG